MIYKHRKYHHHIISSSHHAVFAFVGTLAFVLIMLYYRKTSGRSIVLPIQFQIIFKSMSNSKFYFHRLLEIFLLHTWPPGRTNVGPFIYPCLDVTMVAAIGVVNVLKLIFNLLSCSHCRILRVIASIGFLFIQQP